MTEATIDLSRINANYTLLSKRYSSYCVLKADAYGHGLLPVFRSLYRVGARHFALTDAADAVRLLSERSDAEILLLQMPPRTYFDTLLSLGATFSLSDDASAEELSRFAARRNIRAKCHIAFNSGMNRLGFSLSPDDETATFHAVSHLLRLPMLSVRGFYSHLAFPPTEAASRKAKTRFSSAVSYLMKQYAEKTPPAVHLYASGGTSVPPPDLPFCRPFLRTGLALYGYGASGVLPAMALYTRVLGGFTLRKGERVGYGGTYRAKSDLYTAVLSLGYADGLPRLHNEMTFYAEDKTPLCVIGRVSMNHTVVKDITKPRLSREDRVTVFDRDGTTLPSLAEASAKIPYEILLMGSRAVRTYIE